MPATTKPDARIQWERPPAPWAERIEFLLWQPPESAREQVHEVAPDANGDLLFEVSETGCRAWLYGPVTRRTLIPSRAGCAYGVVHFHPGALPRLVDAHPAELVDSAVELREVGGVPVDALGERLARASSVGQRWAQVSAALTRAKWPPLDTFDRAWRYWAAQGDMPGVAELSEALHLSPRTLERAFQERLGMSPRTFRRIQRLQRVLVRLRSEPLGSLTELAVESGYADHAHLTREFRALMGRAPSEFRAER
jgi:AraC-like DNA-binding protein